MAEEPGAPREAFTTFTNKAWPPAPVADAATPDEWLSTAILIAAGTFWTLSLAVLLALTAGAGVALIVGGAAIAAGVLLGRASR